MLCHCGCGREAKEGNRFIKGHNPKSKRRPWTESVNAPIIRSLIARGYPVPAAIEQARNIVRARRLRHRYHTDAAFRARVRARNRKSR